jgi:arylsulfatase
MRPNILVLCIDQWQRQMKLPPGFRLPAVERLEARGVSFDRYYCPTPICTPSRATMWTGLHSKQVGLWDNTNFAWIQELSPDTVTLGDMLREQGYYTAFKGKWHLSNLPFDEDALEPYGFSDYQQWGEMYGKPLEGELADDTATFEIIDWLEHKGARLEQPWMLACNLVNPHDIMFLQTDPIETPHPNGAIYGLQSRVQDLGWFQERWEVGLPDNFEDDLSRQPYGVRHFKEFVDLNYGRIPDDRPDLWLVRRNYLLNSMRLVDSELQRILETLDRLDMWGETIVILTGDHGEMNGAHRMAQKGSIPFDEATIVAMIVCAPGGPQGRRTSAIGSHLDLAPTLLAFAGMRPEAIAARYPQLKGRSLKETILNPESVGPRGSTTKPGDGVLLGWEGLHQLDNDWAISGALKALTDMSLAPVPRPPSRLKAQMLEAGRTYGAPDFSRRTFFRAVMDGRYKFVRWFSPLEYDLPTTLEALYATSDVALYDLAEDPGELTNLGEPRHPRHDPELVTRMLAKLNALIRHELGEDQVPFDLDLFGTREVTYRRTSLRVTLAPPQPEPSRPLGTEGSVPPEREDE